MRRVLIENASEILTRVCRCRSRFYDVWIWPPVFASSSKETCLRVDPRASALEVRRAASVFQGLLTAWTAREASLARKPPESHGCPFHGLLIPDSRAASAHSCIIVD